MTIKMRDLMMIVEGWNGMRSDDDNDGDPDSDHHSAYGMPIAERDPSQPLYLRIGTWNPKA